MTAGTIVSQGTELFFVDPNAPTALLKMSCPTGITGVTSGASDNLDDTCLDTVGDRTYKGGLGTPGAITVPFNFIPSALSHQRLFDLKTRRTVLQWLEAFSDGVALPVVTAGAMVAPTDRTSFEFRGYIADVVIDVSTNTIVTGTLTIQRSGSYIPHWNGPDAEDVGGDE